MIFVQVCLRLATIKWHSKMCSCITEHNVTDVTSFEGACNWHADCRNAVWHFGEVFSSRMNPGFHCTGQMADSVYGVVWVSGFAVVNRCGSCGPCGGGVMVWAGICYGQWTPVHFSDGILNAQMWRDPEAIVVPFIHDHHFMLQHDNARPHVARICTQFLEAENIPVLAWPAFSLELSPIEHVWDALD